LPGLDLAVALAYIAALVADVAHQLAASILEHRAAEMRANGVGPELSGEAWLDDQQLIRRVRYTIKLGSASGGGSMIVTADFSALGEPVAIDIPDAADVTNAEDVLD